MRSPAHTLTRRGVAHFPRALASEPRCEQRHAMPIVRHRINVARKFFTYLNTFIVTMNVTKPSHLFISR